jgi:hypothetical protein
MARSKGQSHSLSIKLGQAIQERDLLRKQLMQQQDESDVKMKGALDHWGAEVQALKERACAPEQDLTALRDMVVAYDNLFTAVKGGGYNQATTKCLDMLRNSLWEAAVGLGVKRV